MKKKPFFSKFLENQKIETEKVKGGVPKTTMKYPSDGDEQVTLKWPSDGDELQIM